MLVGPFAQYVEEGAVAVLDAVFREAKTASVRHDRPAEPSDCFLVVHAE
jgi:hypothetical protein